VPPEGRSGSLFQADHRPRLEILEDRLAPTANIAITSAFVVDLNDNIPMVVNAGEEVAIQADFTTQGLPSNASYIISYTVNGLTIDSQPLTKGAGGAGTGTWHWYQGKFVALAGTNDVTVVPLSEIPVTLAP